MLTLPRVKLSFQHMNVNFDVFQDDVIQKLPNLKLNGNRPQANRRVL
jgi:hypothetical protein